METQDNVPSNVIARIKKMLALAADSGATEGERDNALRMAHKTLAAYNLDLIQVESHQTPEQKAASGEKREINKHRFYGRAPWARSTAGAIARMMFCHYVYSTDRSDRTNVIHWFIGRQSNAVSAGLMAEYVVKSILAEAKKKAAESWEDRNEFTRTFCVAAGLKVGERCREILEAATRPQPQASGGTALVLASYYQTELEANKQMVVSKPARNSRTKGIYSTEAYQAGLAYGSSVSLNKQIGGR